MDLTTVDAKLEAQALRQKPSQALSELRITLMNQFKDKSCLVLGSAPNAKMPYRGDYSKCFCVNGSPYVARKHSIPIDLTVLVGFTTAKKKDISALSMEMLRDIHSQQLVFISAGDRIDHAVDELKKLNFTYQSISEISPLERAAIIGEVLGEELGLGKRDDRISNGVFTVVLALWAGVSKIIISGISLEGGHDYAKDTERHHIGGDTKCFGLLAKMYPEVQTTSYELHQVTGLPLYTTVAPAEQFLTETISMNQIYNKYRSCFFSVVFSKLAVLEKKQLKKSLPVLGSDNVERYESNTHLEFVGRALCGAAPFIEAGGLRNAEFTIDELYQGISSVTDPVSPDYLNYNQGTQPLVDTAFFALAFIRSPKVLWGGLPENTKQQVITAFKSSRSIKPHFNNWLLFSAMIEAFFFMVGEDYDKMRIDYALRQHEQWYLGDGHYGDGPNFHADYYNSYVILPFLLQITQTLKGQFKDWDNLGVKILDRAKRYAEVQERMISPDGTFPPIGRSIAYRGAAFHLLAQLALMKQLPISLKPAQVRCALWAVIEKTLMDPSNYDENGWLKIGLNGHQPSLGENYISTGSLYLTSVIFLPLGLPEDDEFWSAPDESWTQRKIWWFGCNFPADKALK